MDLIKKSFSKDKLFGLNDEGVNFELKNNAQIWSKEENGSVTTISVINNEDTVVTFEKHKDNELNKYCFLFKQNVNQLQSPDKNTLQEVLDVKKCIESTVLSNRDRSTVGYSNKHSVLERNYVKSTNKTSKLLDYLHNEIGDNTIDLTTIMPERYPSKPEAQTNQKITP